jgi:hypothetical protein
MLATVPPSGYIVKKETCQAAEETERERERE